MKEEMKAAKEGKTAATLPSPPLATKAAKYEDKKPITAEANFEQLIDLPYFVKKSSSSLECTAKVFGDPTPGLDK